MSVVSLPLAPVSEGHARMSEPFSVSEAQAHDWVDAYGRAWAARDTPAVVALFSEDAVYRERRFQPPIVGRAAIVQYWNAHVVEGQRDIAFNWTMLAVRADQAFIHWTAHFTWLPINGIMELDAVARLRFVPGTGGSVLCSTFEEWIEIRDH